MFLTVKNKSSNPIRINAMDGISASEELNCVKLTDALLCVNCEVVVNESRKGSCPVCGSGALLSVSRLLGGTVQPATASARPSQSPSVFPKRCA